MFPPFSSGGTPCRGGGLKPPLLGLTYVFSGFISERFVLFPPVCRRQFCLNLSRASFTFPSAVRVCNFLFRLFSMAECFHTFLGDRYRVRGLFPPGHRSGCAFGHIVPIGNRMELVNVLQLSSSKVRFRYSREFFEKFKYKLGLSIFVPCGL